MRIQLHPRGERIAPKIEAVFFFPSSSPAHARRASSEQAAPAPGQSRGEQGTGTGTGRAEPHVKDEGMADHGRTGEEELG